MSHRVLVVDQDHVQASAFTQALKNAGFDAYGASSVPEAAELFAKRGADVVLLDLLLRDGNAFVLMAGIIGALPKTRIVATTANGAMRQAATALMDGAFDYLVKPIDPQGLLAVVENAARCEIALQETEIAAPTRAVLGPSINATTRALHALAPMMIEGEAGTGKSEIAAFLHAASARADLPFVSVDCAAFDGAGIEDLCTRDLLEKGGTLVLNEPQMLSLYVQSQVLRFLQSPTLADAQRREVNPSIRIICCMAQSPEESVDQGRFREDLFYRLKALRVHLLPLRERCGDIAVLATSVLEQLAASLGHAQKILAEDAARVLQKLQWPGNLVQLREVVTQLGKTCTADEITADLLPREILNEYYDVHSEDKFAHNDGLEGNASNTVSELIRDGWGLDGLERLIIETTIAENGGSIPKAAKQLQVSPSTLYRKREKWK